MNQKDQTLSGADWQRAPRDGSVINVEFPDGEIARARWDLDQGRWHVSGPDGGVRSGLHERHDLPEDWWPEI